MYYDFSFLVMLYSNFVMNTLEKIPAAATASRVGGKLYPIIIVDKNI